MAGLMAGAVEDHVPAHLVDRRKHPDAFNTEAAEHRLSVVRTYLKQERPMTEAPTTEAAAAHGHVFLAPSHQSNERRAWAVIVLCGAMMVGEIVGGLLFGSIALVADGLHMSTHAGALLLAALAYTYSRRYADDPRFTFGTGKFGDLAGFTSAIVLAMIALLIGYEAVTRFLHPVPIHFGEAIPIAGLGLAVNLASAWLLGAGGHDHHPGHHPGHHHGHSRGHDHGHDHEAEVLEIATAAGPVLVTVFEDGVPPRFRVRRADGAALAPGEAKIETVRPDGARQAFRFVEQGVFVESVEEIPEPHAFTAFVTIGDEQHTLVFSEHEHGAHDRDNNMRSAIVHVVADAMVSVLVIAGLVLARWLGWLWMDPLAGAIGALVIASWSYGLIRDTGAILLDMNPDRQLANQIRQVIETSGDAVADLHLWRLGPGHLGAILSVATDAGWDEAHYRAKLAPFPMLSHVTVEIVRARQPMSAAA
ncbi:MAG TPA: CDF family Co(II)/Ni(II) efflux transporter DmeF [Rhodopila sp.]|nr:CDF family Co(II)/Ni(II) efflux transporter DmeF [Rhodopila sp.]HVY16276.1 CDF family Co(II)/Ni(II) efflux transporter DmeF [Rhodopila sp.]